MTVSRLTIRMGTRGSKLALAQADWVEKRLQETWPELEIERVIIRTHGDRVQDRPFHEMGSLGGVFIKEIEKALLDDTIDFAVHSGKDVPSQVAEGLKLAAICEREDPRDVFVSYNAKRLTELPSGSTVGTSSLRRQAIVLKIRPDVRVVPIRGNVDSRLAKLKDGEVDALILAAAGLKRLHLTDRITEYLDPEQFLPSPAQGSVVLECRRGDERIERLLAPLHDEVAGWLVSAERAFLAGLGAGCQIPLAAHATLQGERTLRLRGLVASPDGKEVIEGLREGDVNEAEHYGADLAHELTERGAARILQEWRNTVKR